MRKNQSGLSMVEALVALGMMAMGAVALMRMTEFQHKNARSVESKMEVNTLHNAIHMIILNSNACSNTLGQMPHLDALGDDVGTSIDAIKTKSSSVDAYEKGQEISNLIKIEDILLFADPDSPFSSIGNCVDTNGVPQTDCKEGSVILELTYKKLSKMAQGGLLIKKRININVQTDSSGGIIRCFSAAENTIDTARQIFCQQDLKGTFDINGNPGCTVPIDPTTGSGQDLTLADDNFTTAQYVKLSIQDYRDNFFNADFDDRFKVKLEEFVNGMRFYARIGSGGDIEDETVACDDPSHIRLGCSGSRNPNLSDTHDEEDGGIIGIIPVDVNGCRMTIDAASGSDVTPVVFCMEIDNIGGTYTFNPTMEVPSGVVPNNVAETTPTPIPSPPPPPDMLIHCGCSSGVLACPGTHPLQKGAVFKSDVGCTPVGDGQCVMCSTSPPPTP